MGNWIPLNVFGVDTKDIPPWVWSSVRSYGRWKAYGFLPNAGGLNDQGEKVMQSFDVLSSEIALWEEERAKREKAKAKASGGSSPHF
tara:strand:- start:128 stop:388 length:261 start_codon:yes stop_codon:yes gene_type:complete